jgi:hypothetical protein
VKRLKTAPEHAREELEALAAQGSVLSMLRLGWVFSTGEYLLKDESLAEYWYKRAWNAGCVDGGYYLAILYQNNGRLEEAFTAFKAGAEEYFTPSMNRLGLAYKNGLGVKKNLDLAKLTWETSSNLGHVFSRRHLAFLLISGRYGLSAIPVGFKLLASAVINGLQIYRTYRTSNLVRG